MTVWRAIPGWEGLYEASDDGQVRSVERITGGYRRRGVLICGSLVKGGYRQICLSREGGRQYLLVHRLVALTFIGPCPDGLQACHNDGDSSNNAVRNLRYDTASANELDKVRHGTHHYGARTSCSQGHAFDEANTLWRGDGGRRCKACRRAYYTERRAA
jgi:hypothetical protein